MYTDQTLLFITCRHSIWHRTGMCRSPSPFLAILPARFCMRSVILMAAFCCLASLRPLPAPGLARLSARPRDIDLDPHEHTHRQGLTRVRLHADQMCCVSQTDCPYIGPHVRRFSHSAHRAVASSPQVRRQSSGLRGAAALSKKLLACGSPDNVC